MHADRINQGFFLNLIQIHEFMYGGSGYRKFQRQKGDKGMRAVGKKRTGSRSDPSRCPPPTPSAAKKCSIANMIKKMMIQYRPYGQSTVQRSYISISLKLALRLPRRSNVSTISSKLNFDARSFSM
jgi:hypothetical protein